MAKTRIDRTAIRIAAAIRGCTCEPGIRHRDRKGVRHIEVAHDVGCPAADTGSQLVLARGRHQTPEEFAGAVIAVSRALTEESAP